MAARADSQWLRLRHAVDLLSKWEPLQAARAPSQGLMATIRRALPMSGAQLAARMSISRQLLEALHVREVARTTTFAALRRAADALDCDLVYALVPPQASLDAAVAAQAHRVAERLVQRAGHTMALEEQHVPARKTEDQIAVVTRRLFAEWPRDLWDDIANPTPRQRGANGAVA